MEQVYKPGSVFGSHLSRHIVANMLKPPPKDGRAGHMRPFHGVAPNRVYSLSLLPGRGVSSYLTFPPLLRVPVQPAYGAVYLCCTFPEVTLGGRYPLFLPCGARTFLTNGFSASFARPPGLLEKIFYRIIYRKSIFD